MIDFADKKQTYAVSEVPVGKFDSTIRKIYVDGEESVACYATEKKKDYLIFTNKRIIVVNVQGITGLKQDYSCVFYKTIQAFSVTTAGPMEDVINVELNFAGLGIIYLSFPTTADVGSFLKMIGKFVL